MPYIYSDPERENDPNAVRDVEVFYRTARDCKLDGWKGRQGWYWWNCSPGGMPDRDPTGPFASFIEAQTDARLTAESKS